MQNHETPRHCLPEITDTGIDPFTEGYVKKRARLLAGKFGFQQDDHEEIEQTLFLRLVKHLHRANPDDPKWKAFVAKTVSRHIANMIRDNEAQKRDHRRVRSIHIIIGEDDDGPVELAEILNEDDGRARHGTAPRSEQERVDLRIDIAEFLESLNDPEMRELLERRQHDSTAGIADDMQVPRTTLSSRLSKLRQKFEDRGLQEYL